MTGVFNAILRNFQVYLLSLKLLSGNFVYYFFILFFYFISLGILVWIWGF